MSDASNVPTLRMAFAAGAAVASIYYNQPMLALIGRDFPNSGVEGLIPTVTQLGYALGLVLLVPLGDLFERRALIAAQFALLALALLLTSVAPNVPLLVAASLVLGASATVAQQIVPFAAQLAPPDKRGAAVGTVMAGLLSGILLSRTVAGAIASQSGFRTMFALAVPFVLVVATVVVLALPRAQAPSQLGYGALLRSLGGLWRRHPALRRSALIQASLFAAFSAFWTTLALRLAEPPFRLGPGAAGAFGVIGLVGVLAAPIAGRVADRRGPHLLVLVGALLTALSWLCFGLSDAIAWLVVGVVLLDFGAQVALVSNQAIIYALEPEARSRLNSLFMATMFAGGALGSAASTTAFARGGFSWVSALGVIVSLVALALSFARR